MQGGQRGLGGLACRIGLGGTAQGLAAEGLGLTVLDRRGPFAKLGERVRGQVEQGRRGPVLIGDLAVEHLFERPGGFAIVAQADHARAAFEGVKSAAQAGERAFVVEIGVQLLQLFAAACDDLPGFLQEDVDQFVFGIVFGLGRRGRLLGGFRRDSRLGRGCGRLLRGGGVCLLGRVSCTRPFNHTFAGHAQHLRRKIGYAGQGGLGVQLGQALLRLLGRQPLGDVVLELLRRVLDVLLQGGRGGALSGGNDGAQLFFVGVEHEQGFGQLGLVGQHVDQEAEHADIAGQGVEALAVGRRIVGHEAVDFGAQVAQRLAGDIDPEHREHAAHLRQQMRRLRQIGLVRRVAEIGVEQFLDGVHVGAQFLHHAAHGLRLGGLAEQVFHPVGQRVRRLAVGALVEPSREDL